MTGRRSPRLHTAAVLPFAQRPSVRVALGGLAFAAVVTLPLLAPPRAETQVAAREPAATDVGIVDPTARALGTILSREKERSGSASGTDLNDLLAVYETLEAGPVWLDGAAPNSDAKALLRRIENAARHGLEPEDYLLGAIRARWQSTDVVERAELDLLLTEAFIRLARDLWSGRTHRLGVRTRHFDLTPLPFDVTALAADLRSRGVEAALTAREPANAQYRTLVDALSRLLAEEEQAAEKPELKAGPVLRKGSRGERVAVLRTLMTMSGDLPPADARSPHEPGRPERTEADLELFDDALVAAVERYQGRSGLKVDGIVGPQTIAHMNKGREDQIRQLRASLERWRLLPRIGSDRYVVVNLPAFELHAYDGAAEPLSMKIVVGRYRRKTPLFSSRINRIVANPTWTVPRTILREDFLPKLREDPGYLARQGLRLISRDGGGEIDPWSVDWWQYSGRESMPFLLRQPPGRNNALGQVKFLLPNNESIYLHDTNHPSLFRRAERAYSSGCVRLEAPREFTAYLIRGDSTLGKQSLDHILRGGGQRWLSLESPIPVHLTYITAWVNTNGNIEYKRDIYGHDRSLLDALERSHLPPQEQAQTSFLRAGDGSRAG